MNTNAALQFVDSRESNDYPDIQCVVGTNVYLSRECLEKHVQKDLGPKVFHELLQATKCEVAIYRDRIKTSLTAYQLSLVDAFLADLQKRAHASGEKLSHLRFNLHLVAIDNGVPYEQIEFLLA